MPGGIGSISDFQPRGAARDARVLPTGCAVPDRDGYPGERVVVLDAKVCARFSKTNDAVLSVTPDRAPQGVWQTDVQLRKAGWC